ncbi:MAG: helix-turn-helix domain-containing protein [Methanocellales archaeon]
MALSDEIIYAAIENNEIFRKKLSEAISELGLTIAAFARKSKIPLSTLYKILSGEREPNLKTLRIIIKTVRNIEGARSGRFIAVIASRPVLDALKKRTIEIKGEKFSIREYPVNSIEESIIAAVRAEREGAAALVCAPITSSTVEKILRIPVAAIIPRESLSEALETAAKKIQI